METEIWLTNSYDTEAKDALGITESKIDPLSSSRIYSKAEQLRLAVRLKKRRPFFLSLVSVFRTLMF